MKLSDKFGFNRKKPNKTGQTFHDQRKIVGKQLDFAASEAYKLLRTNLIFSMTDERKCKIIGITSALRGEGKSTTSINIAFSLAEISEKVLLVEADMRIPIVAKLLRFNHPMGLSHVLAGVCELKKAIFKSASLGRPYIMPAGEIPPNPAELLASEKMRKVIGELAESFDYIIVDLPPITAVSDSLAISKLLSGMIVVVRRDYCDQRALADAMSRMEFLQVKVLGFVMNCADSRGASYRKYGHRYSYYKHSYGYGYAARRSKNADCTENADKTESVNSKENAESFADAEDAGV